MDLSQIIISNVIVVMIVTSIHNISEKKLFVLAKNTVCDNCKLSGRVIGVVTGPNILCKICESCVLMFFSLDKPGLE